MNALRLSLLLLCAGLAAAGCGRSEGSDGNRYASKGVTVELPPFEPNGDAIPPEGENAVESLNVLVPAAAEGEPKAADKAEKVEPRAPEPAADPAAEAPASKQDPAAAPEPKAPAKAEEPSTTSPATARMPLSNERVASTIDRIGFPCGAVVSAQPVEGASVPTWRISCSSGSTYQGTNRSGHMRFRKWQ